MTALLLLALFIPKWVHIHDGLKSHERYEMRYADGSVNVLGEYYQIAPGELLAVCYEGDVHAFGDEQKAREFVLGCEVWE